MTDHTNVEGTGAWRACSQEAKGSLPCLRRHRAYTSSAYLEGRLVGAGSLCRLQTRRVHDILDEQLHLEGDDCSLHLSTLSAGVWGMAELVRRVGWHARIGEACRESRHVVVARAKPNVLFWTRTFARCCCVPATADVLSFVRRLRRSIDRRSSRKHSHTPFHWSSGQSAVDARF